MSVSNISQMPGKRMTADTVLGQRLEAAKAGEIKNVSVIWEDVDGRVYSTWSNMNTSMLTFHEKVFGMDIVEAIEGRNGGVIDPDASA